MTLLHRTAPSAVAGRHAVDRHAGVGRGRGWLVQRTVRVSQVLVVAALALGLAAPGWLQSHQVWVLGAGFLLGLPHGAVDHLLPARYAWVRRGPVGMLVVLTAYLGLSALTFVALRLAGPVVLPLLLAVSVLHFGAGDAATEDRGEPSTIVPRGGWPARPGVGLLLAVGRGGPVLAGPLLAWSASTGAALATVGLGAAPSRTTDTVVGMVLLGTSTACATLALHHRRPGVAGEIGLLVALFLLVPPLAAFGVYFGAWHGLRHTARLLTDDPANADDLDRGRLARPVGRFAAAAAVPTLVALTTVALLAATTRDHPGLIGPVFDVLLALTVPHVVVVALLDRRERRSEVTPDPGPQIVHTTRSRSR